MTTLPVFEAIRERIDNSSSDYVTRVGINGIDGSGKTTFANGLADYLRQTGKQIIRSGIDGFNNVRDIRHRQGYESPVGYYHDSFNINGLIKNLLDPLSPGGSLRYRRYIFDYPQDHESHAPVENASTGDILVFDGVFLFRPELIEYWDLKIFLDVSFEEALERVRSRQTDLDYLGSDEAIVRRYRTRYFPGERLYFAEADPINRADLVIDNTDFRNPVLLPE